MSVFLMDPDELFVALQIASLFGLIVYEMSKRSGRNLYAVFIAASLVLIVHGQAWWMFRKFDETGSNQIRHLYQTISIQGARLANIYMGVFTGLFIFFYFLHLRLYKYQLNISGKNDNERNSPGASPSGSLGTTGLALAWTLVSGYFLTDLAGGVVAAVEKPGQAMVGGVAMFLVLTYMGKFPLLFKISSGGRINALEIVAFSASVILCLLNSRFLTIFIFLQFTLLYNYGRREISRSAMVKLGSLAFFVLIVFGFYRDYTSKSDVISMESLVSFFESRTGQDSPFEWFYSANVEGFAGLAGIVSYDLEVGGIEHDYGLSTLGFSLRFIPFQLRNDKNYPFMEWNDELMAAYPYVGSVVQPGTENCFAHWGVLGIFLLGAFLGVLASWMHLRMSDKRSDKITIGILSVHSLELIRGSLSLGIFWFLCDYIMLFIFRSSDVFFVKKKSLLDRVGNTEDSTT